MQPKSNSDLSFRERGLIGDLHDGLPLERVQGQLAGLGLARELSRKCPVDLVPNLQEALGDFTIQSDF